MSKKAFALIAVLLSMLFVISCADDIVLPEIADTINISGIDSQMLSEVSISESVLPPLPPPPPIETGRVSFVAAGDNVIHPSIYIEAQKQGTLLKATDVNAPEYYFEPVYSNVREYISSFDLAFINQETLLAGSDYGYSGYPTFNSPREVAYDLIDVGFDVVNIANNHICDQGRAGLRSTIEFWKTLDVTMIGGYSDADDFNEPRVIEKNGIKIAFVGFTEETNGIRLPKSELIIPYTKDEDVIRVIVKARENADFVIVSVHWGNENQTTVSSEQKRIAKLMCESGADVILGHHPHVLQELEWIKSGDRTALCIYSLGNFVSGMKAWQNMAGGLLSFEIVMMSDGSTFVESTDFLPTVFHYKSSNLGGKVYFMKDYTEELAASHGVGPIYGNYFKLSEMRNYVESIIYKNDVLKK